VHGAKFKRDARPRRRGCFPPRSLPALAQDLLHARVDCRRLGRHGEWLAWGVEACWEEPRSLRVLWARSSAHYRPLWQSRVRICDFKQL
jgi:hypothetical protein